MADIQKIQIGAIEYDIVDAGARTLIAGKADAADLAGYFDGAVYDSTTKRINFKHGNDVVAFVDAAPFVVDGMVDNVEISGGNLVITFNTDAGKQAINIALTDIFNPANYYTKNEVDTALGGKQDTLVSGTNIKTVGGQSLLGEGNIEVGSTIEVDAALDANSENPVQNKVVKGALDAKANTADLATVATSGDYEDLTNKPSIPTVPTNVSAFTNDAGYVSATVTGTTLVLSTGAAAE